jgi:hypothetical protein
MAATTKPTSTSNATKTSTFLGSYFRRKVMFAVLGLVAAVTALASLRLAAVVSATPAGLWLEEVPRLVDPRFGSDALLASRATAVGKIIADPALVTARVGACDKNDAAAQALCAGIVNAALAADPSSGELWTFKAWTLAHDADYGPATFTALRNSYAFARREGWIAADRVVLGLTLYPLLPDDLRSDVAADLQLVLESRLALYEPLIQAYAHNPHLQDTARDALRALPADDLNYFVSLMRQQLGS